MVLHYIVSQHVLITDLHLCDVDGLVDENPGGRLVTRRHRDGALVGDVAGGVRVQVCYVEAHQ